MRKPYTYRIGWTDQDIYYYGVRWGNGMKEPEDDLWKRYFTSSLLVEEFRKIYGEPDLIEIRKRFDNKHTARYWERNVLEKFAKKAPNYLNDARYEHKDFSEYLLNTVVGEQTS